jgi:hypothetical protein
MTHKVTLLEGDDYDLDDEAEPEYDLTRMKRAAEQERKYRALASSHLVRLAPDVAEFFTSAEAVNEALRRVMREARGER